VTGESLLPSDNLQATIAEERGQHRTSSRLLKKTLLAGCSKPLRYKGVTGTGRKVQGARKKQQREILETSTLKTVYRVP